MKKTLMLLTVALCLSMTACSKEESAEESTTSVESSTEGDYLQAANGDEEVKIEISEMESSDAQPSEDKDYVNMMGIPPVSDDWNEDGIEGIKVSDELIAQEIAEAKELGWRVIPGHKQLTEENKAELIEYFGGLNKCNILDEFDSYVNYYEPDCDDVYFWDRIGVLQGCDPLRPVMYGTLDCGEKGVHDVQATYVGDNLYYSGWIIECYYFDKGDPLREND